jgi:hypothetical protein
MRGIDIARDFQEIDEHVRNIRDKNAPLSVFCQLGYRRYPGNPVSVARTLLVGVEAEREACEIRLRPERRICWSAFQLPGQKMPWLQCLSLSR